MEREFLGRYMKYIRVSPVHNGVSWTLSRLCQQIATAYSAFDLKTRVVVWVDREGRTETAGEIRAEIRAALVTAGAADDAIFILVNDRMVENLLLADEVVIRGEFGVREYQYDAEGRNGKRRLKELFSEKGQNYKEMIHGVTLLKKIELDRCGLVSPSANAFVSEYTDECWWIKRPE